MPNTLDFDMDYYLDRWQMCMNKRTGLPRRTLHAQRTQEWKFVFEDDEIQTWKQGVDDLRKLPESVKIAGNYSLDTTADYENGKSA